MDQLTKEDYRNIVRSLGVLKMMMVSQTFPLDMQETLKKECVAFIVKRADDLQATIDKICRIHLD
jgi:hypothetical protein